MAASSKYDNISGNNESNSKNETIVTAPIFDTAVFAVDFAKAVRRFLYIVVVLALVSGMAFGFLSYYSYTPMYESSVSFSVTAVSYNSAGNAVFASYYDNNYASQLSKTFPYIVNTSMMRNALKNELDKTYINGTITASAVASDSNIFKVSVSSSSAQDAYDIINAVIEVYPSVASFVVGNIHLNILIQPTLPEDPYTTNNFIRIGIIMTLAGATAGFALIAVYAFFRKTIRKKDDFKNLLNQKCYVEIPYVVFYRKSNDKKNKDKIVRITDRHPTFKESFRLLRKRLLRNLTPDEKVIAITSAADGEGKTMTSLNLAHSLAISGKKTACVDFDLNKRSLQKYLMQDDCKGFTDIIFDDSSDFMSVAYTPDDNLDVYFSGNASSEYSEADFVPFFDYLRNNYDYVIVNLAPGREIANSLSISNFCDCMLFVVYQDRISIDRIRKTLEYMSFSSARILGFAFNGVQEGFTGYGGYYYGGKYGYGKYGYGRYGYGRYGYGKRSYGSYGYGKSGYGYGYGYGEKDDKIESEHTHKHKHKNKHHKNKAYKYGYGYGYGYGDDSDAIEVYDIDSENTLFDVNDVDDLDIPDKS